MINLTVVIDNDEAVRKLHELQKVAKETTSSVVKDSERMDATWRQMRNTIMSVTAGLSLAGLAKQVVSVRGEVQQLEVAFETMLGSKQKAYPMMSEIIELAAKTPFGLQDVSNGAKMLLAYGSAAEEVVDEIKMLGNIASGLSIPLNDLIYLYGTTRTQGRMFTQDLRQFMGRGIPLAEELAKQFGVAKDEVGGLVTAGRVGFEEMREALVAMTSEGGKFNDLMEKQSQTISGQISNLGDSIYQMFNEIGESSEGVINDILVGASWVVEHYKEILNVLKYLVVAYGSYKAALMLVAAGHKAMALVRFAGDLINAARGVKSLTAAVKALGVATKANPIGLLLSGVGLLVTALIDFNDEAPEAAKQMGEMERAAREEYEQVNLLASMLTDTNLSEKQRKEILEELNGISPKIVEGLDAESLSLERLTENVYAYNEAQKKAIQNSVLGDEYKQLIDRVTAAEAALATNTLDITKEAQKYFKGDEWKATFRTDARGGVMVNPEWANEYFALVEKRIQENEGNSLALANALREDILNGEAANINPLFTVKGSTLTDWAHNRTYLEAELEAAKAALDEYVKLYPQIKEELDRVSEGTGEEDKLYTKELQDAATAYKGAYDKLQTLLSNPKAKASEVSEAREILKSAEDKYKSLGGKTFDEQKKEEERKRKELEEEAKKTKEKEKQIAEITEKIRQEAQQSDIKAMQEGTDKKIAQAEFDYQRRIDQVLKEEKKLREAQDGTLSAEQEENFATIKKNEERELDKIVANIYRTEFNEMNKFLGEYGTFQQRKLAIASDYADKISKAENEAAKMSLSKERDSRLASLKAAEIESSIDWELVFGDFGDLFIDYMRPQFNALAEYIKTDEFKEADASDKQAIMDVYNKLEDRFGESEGVSFKKLGASVQNLVDAQSRLQTAQANYAESFALLQRAQNDYIAAVQSGDEALISVAEANLALYEEIHGRNTENVEEAENKAADAQREVTDTAKTLENALSSVVSGLNTLSSGSISTLIPALQQTASGLANIEGKFGSAMSKLAEGLSNTPAAIIGLVLQLLDILKDGISGLLVPIIDAIFNAIIGIVGDILNFRDGLFRQIGESLYKGILGIFRAILTLGGWFDWFGDGESDKTLEKDVERLSEVNEALQRSIEHLTETMDYNAETYDRQKSLLDDAISNTQQMMARSGAAYSSGFLGVGGAHSSNYNINRNMSSLDWERISDIIDKDIASAEEFFNLTSAEMLKIAQEAPDLYGKIKDLANDGHKDAAQYMDAYIEYAEQIEELERKHNEFLTKTSFDSFRDEFLNTLTDMEMSSEDFANNFNKMLVQSIAEALMADKYDEAIEELYKQWADAMTDGVMTDEEREALERGRQDIYDRMEEDREFIRGFLNTGAGVDGQSATSKGFAAMSQETGDELNGRFTDIQGKVSGIYEGLQFLKQLDAESLKKTESISQTVAMIHNDTMLIEKHTRVLADMNYKLEQIRKNTEGL